ncbi:MAG: TRAP transporter small permease subunit [Acidimicrobiia bacterium]|nr:TRAP transporter small permease subunit [Acidimicrobiia bacterium]
MWLVIPTVAIGAITVLLRYIGRQMGTALTTPGYTEIQLYLYGGIFLFGFAYILKHQINVRVDFWFAHQPQRRKAWIDFVGHLISLVPFCLLAIWVSVPQVVTSWRLNEQSTDAGGLPRAPIKTLIVVGFILLLIQAVAELVRLIAVLKGRPDLVDLEEVEEPLRIE